LRNARNARSLKIHSANNKTKARRISFFLFSQVGCKGEPTWRPYGIRDIRRAQERPQGRVNTSIFATESHTRRKTHDAWSFSLRNDPLMHLMAFFYIFSNASFSTTNNCSCERYRKKSSHKSKVIFAWTLQL